MPGTEGITAAFNRAMEWLHGKRIFGAAMLKEKPVRALMEETAAFLSRGIERGIQEDTPSEAMVDSLRESAGVFSGFKTFHEMKEAADRLLDKEGNLKTFEQFSKDVQGINETYNRHYLRTEYAFAVQSASMASRWEEQQDDGGGRYLLQYRTAGDSKVRKEHREMEGITLPPDDPFWDKYYPPNGWNCRCTVVKVRAAKYPSTDSKAAMEAGDKAVSGKHAEMFRFNPGKQRAAYPAYNSYTISKCSTCTKNGLELAKIPSNELCAACPIIRECVVTMEETYNHGKGTVSISNLVNRGDSDYQKLIQIAEEFAKNGATVRLTPKMSRPPKFKYECFYRSLSGTKYEGKCPDLEIDGKWYEHEGFITNNPKRALKNMLNDGLKQSNRLIIDKPDLTDSFIKRNIWLRNKEGQDIQEVWLKEGDKIRLLYKKSEE